MDKVGDAPPEAQIALLRVLQERKFEGVGGTCETGPTTYHCSPDFMERIANFNNKTMLGVQIRIDIAANVPKAF